MVWYFLWIHLCIAPGLVRASELFDEELLIKDTGTGYTVFHFNFVSKTPEYPHTSRSNIFYELFSQNSTTT